MIRMIRMIILPGGAYRPPPGPPWTPGLRPGGRKGRNDYPGQYFEHSGTGASGGAGRLGRYLQGTGIGRV